MEATNLLTNALATSVFALSQNERRLLIPRPQQGPSVKRIGKSWRPRMIRGLAKRWICALLATAIPLSLQALDIIGGPVTNAASGHIYYLLAESTWPAAEAEAVRLGGHLATINSQAEQDWIAQTFYGWGGNTNRYFWIGLNDRLAEGSFVWASGETVAYTDWRAGEPNDNGGEDCAEMVFWDEDTWGQWNDLSDAVSRYEEGGGQRTIARHGVVEILPYSGWIQWPITAGGNGHWYALTREEHRGWGLAEAEAQSHAGGHLVSINSVGEQEFLEAAFLSGHSVSNAYWIGFNDFAKEGEWTWSTDEPVTFTYWHQGEPNNASSSEDGAIMNWQYSLNGGGFGDWNDYFENTRTYRGIIEVQDTYPPLEVEVVPWNQKVPPGATAEFRAYTYGLGTDVHYRWQFNGTDIPGATNETLILGNLARSQSGDYSVVAVLPGPDLLSQPAPLTVSGPPVLVSQPASRAVSEGGTTEFAVAVGGEGPFTYEWLFNGVPIPNATQPTLSLSNAKSTQTGSYSVRVSNPDGSISSTPAKLTVIPLGFTVIYANDFEGAVGSEWSNRNTTTTPVGGRRYLGRLGTGAAELTLPGVPDGSSILLGFDLYLLRSWDGNHPVDSGPDVWILRSGDGRELLRTTFSNVGDTQSYPAAPGGGSFPRFTGAVEKGTLTDYYYPYPEVTMDSVYGLRFLVSQAGGPVSFTFEAPALESLDNESWGLDNVVVAVATTAVGSPPEILQAPESQVVRQGDTAVFRVLASGTAPLYYQWRFNNSDISGATNDFLAVQNAGAEAAGRYSVVVENAYGLISRSPANLTILIAEPNGQTVNAGHGAAFTVELAGEANLQWRRGDLDLAGQTNPILQLGPVKPEQAGRYTVLISNGGKPFQSTPAHLAVPTAGHPGSKLWAYGTGSSPYGILGSPALATDGTLYVATFSGDLVALSSSGVEGWRVRLGWSVGSPAVGADGTVYVGGGAGIHAVSPQGRLLWSKMFDGGGYIHSAPAIAADGTIYVGAINPGTLLYALKPDGSEKWRFDASARIYSAPAIAADGTVYFGTLDNTALFFAVRPDGTELWRRSAKANWDYSSPAIAADGTVLFSADRVYSLDRSGTARWEFTSGGQFVASGALNREGELLQSDNLGILQVVSAQGMLVRSVDLGAWVQYSPGVAISDQGTAYVFADDLRLHAVSATGDVIWSFATGGRIKYGTPHSRPSPTIGPDGTIYLGDLDGKLYAIKGDGPPAQSSWPMFRHDAQHTGRMPLLLEATDLNVSVGANVTMRAVTGEQRATFQWRRNGKALANETNAVLILSQVTPAQRGEYDVVMTYANGAARSHTATLNVDATFTTATTGPVVTDTGDSCSVAWGDYDGDDWLDLLVANSSMQTNALYRNNRDGTFTKVVNATPVLDAGDHTTGVWGDYDNDGQLDLFVTKWALNNSLFRRDVSEAFVAVTAGNIVNDDGNSWGAAWGDYDRDGNLDLFVINRSAQKNFLYHNNGDGSFTRITSGSVVNETGDEFTHGAWADYDGDGDLDLLVTGNDGVRLFRSDHGQFTKITSGSLATDSTPSLGASWGDYDNDGDLDCYIVPGRLYQNDGGGHFTSVTGGAATAPTGSSLGSAWGDYDNDGWLDLFVGNMRYEGNRLLRNLGDGTFVSIEAGSVTSDRGHSHGVAWADYDNNGFLDLVVSNRGLEGHPAPANFLYRNNGNGNGCLKVRLVGTLSNASAIGAKVRVRATVSGRELWQLREISSSTGFGGENALEVHFGLGDATAVDVVRIEWPSGIVQEFANVEANRFLNVTEPPVLTPGVRWANGDFELILTSRGGFDYAIEATEDLVSWKAIGTIQQVNGSVQFVDTQARAQQRRFYRAVKR